MKLSVEAKALEFLDKLDAKRYRQVARAVFALLAEPYPHDSQQLQGWPGLRRRTVGEFRIVYEVVEDTVRVIVIGRRNDDAVYREMRRRRS